MNRRLEVLATPGFVGGLCLLLVSDFFLKHLFSNWFTGKLSDFAGLFIFPIFWAAVVPRQKKAIFAATGILFIFWKLAWSQPLIDYWNDLAIWPVTRIVDPGDLIALLILPVSYSYFDRPRVLYRPSALYFIATIAVFAFTATSRARETRFDFTEKYHFPMTRISLLRKLYQLDRTIPDYRVSTCS